MASLAPVLVAGKWQESVAQGEFRAENPATGEMLAQAYPVSTRHEALSALQAGAKAAEGLREVAGEALARFLEDYAARIEGAAAELVDLANAETGLPKAPRLKDVELPRTTDQLRQAAKAARDGSWRDPVRDEAKKILAVRAPLGGPVVVYGPNNFPFAFNSVAGGDFAAAIAAHNPVIAKANTGHPGTSRRFGELAFQAVEAAGLPPATVQLLYRIPPTAGVELAGHRLTGATGFTGSRAAGIVLKTAADRNGKPIYLEMSSVNPVVILDGALRERGPALAEEFFASCTLGAGQFCTNPGFIVLPDTEAGRAFVEAARAKFAAGTPGVLLAKGVRDGLVQSVEVLKKHGAQVLCGGEPMPEPGYRFANTLLTVTGEQFLAKPEELQTEAFGPVALLVMARDGAQIAAIAGALEGNLTGALYTDTKGADDADYRAIEPALRARVGRLLNDKMPTGVAVSPAMNHGGPFPATGHPGFTAVGIPASIRRFTALHCYDNVRPDRLPPALR